MSYINKKIRAFNKGPVDEIVSIRSEGRMKNYPSASDIRAWSDTVEERRQHILEYMAKNKRGVCSDKLIPLDVLIDAMMAQKNARIKKLEKRIEYLEKLLDIYSQLDLTAEQKKKLDQLRKDIEEAYAELESLKSERDDLETVYERKRKSDEYPGGKPKKRDKKRPKGESEGEDPTRRAKRKKKARVPAREVSETSGDEETSAPKKYKGKRKSADGTEDSSFPNQTTALAEAENVPKKDKPKKKTVPSSPSDSTGKKKRTGATDVKGNDEPHLVHEQISKRAGTNQMVFSKKPISDTEYEPHLDKGQGKEVFPQRKEKTDITAEPRSKTPKKTEPKSSEQKTKEQSGEDQKAPLSKKLEKPSIGDENKSKGTERFPRKTSKDTKQSRTKSIPEEVEKPTIGDKTKSKDTERFPRKTSKDTKQSKTKSIPEQGSSKKSTESKPKATKTEEGKDIPGRPEKTMQRKPSKSKSLPDKGSTKKSTVSGPKARTLSETDDTAKKGKNISGISDRQRPAQGKPTKSKPGQTEDITPKSRSSKVQQKPTDQAHGSNEPVEKPIAEGKPPQTSTGGKGETNIGDDKLATRKIKEEKVPQMSTQPVEKIEKVEDQPKKKEKVVDEPILQAHRRMPLQERVTTEKKGTNIPSKDDAPKEKKGELKEEKPPERTKITDRSKQEKPEESMRDDGIKAATEPQEQTKLADEYRQAKPDKSMKDEGLKATELQEQTKLADKYRQAKPDKSMKDEGLKATELQEEKKLADKYRQAKPEKSMDDEGLKATELQEQTKLADKSRQEKHKELMQDKGMKKMTDPKEGQKAVVSESKSLAGRGSPEQPAKVTPVEDSKPKEAKKLPVEMNKDPDHLAKKSDEKKEGEQSIEERGKVEPVDKVKSKTLEGQDKVPSKKTHVKEKLPKDEKDGTIKDIKDEKPLDIKTSKESPITDKEKETIKAGELEKGAEIHGEMPEIVELESPVTKEREQVLISQDRGKPDDQELFDMTDIADIADIAQVILPEAIREAEDISDRREMQEETEQKKGIITEKGVIPQEQLLAEKEEIEPDTKIVEADAEAAPEQHTFFRETDKLPGTIMEVEGIPGEQQSTKLPKGIETSDDIIARSKDKISQVKPDEVKESPEELPPDDEHTGISITEDIPVEEKYKKIPKKKEIEEDEMKSEIPKIKKHKDEDMQLEGIETSDVIKARSKDEIFQVKPGEVKESLEILPQDKKMPEMKKIDEDAVELFDEIKSKTSKTQKHEGEEDPGIYSKLVPYEGTDEEIEFAESEPIKTKSVGVPSVKTKPLETFDEFETLKQFPEKEPGKKITEEPVSVEEQMPEDTVELKPHSTEKGEMESSKGSKELTGRDGREKTKKRIEDMKETGSLTEDLDKTASEDEHDVGKKLDQDVGESLPQKDVQVQHRCAALVRHAKKRCAAMASRSGGIVALPDPKSRQQDIIPTGYWSGGVLPELLPPQSIRSAPDWAKKQEIVKEAALLQSDDNPASTSFMKKECRAPCSKRIDQPRKKSASQHELKSNAVTGTEVSKSLGSTIAKDEKTGVDEGTKPSGIGSEPIDSVVSKEDGFPSEVVTPRSRKLEKDMHALGEDTREVEDKPSGKSSGMKYSPKLELTWEEIDFEELTEDDDKFDGRALMGSRISRVLSGDTSGLGTSPFPVAYTGSKTLSGEILQRRLSEKILQKESSGTKGSQSTDAIVPEQEMVTNIPEGGKPVEEQVKKKDEHNPVIKLFERNIELNGDVTSEEQMAVKERIYDNEKLPSEYIKENKLESEIEQPKSVGIKESESQYQDIEKTESRNSQKEKTMGTEDQAILEQEEFISAIDTSKTKDEEDILEEIPEQKASSPSKTKDEEDILEERPEQKASSPSKTKDEEDILEEIPEQKASSPSKTKDEEGIFKEIPEQKASSSLSKTKDEEDILEEIPEQKASSPSKTKDEEDILEEIPEQKAPSSHSKTKDEEDILEEIPEQKASSPSKTKDEEDILEKIPEQKASSSLSKTKDEEDILEEIPEQKASSPSKTKDEEGILEEIPEQKASSASKTKDDEDILEEIAEQKASSPSKTKYEEDILEEIPEQKASSPSKTKDEEDILEEIPEQKASSPSDTNTRRSEEEMHISSNIPILNIEVQEQTSPVEQSTAQEPQFIEGIPVVEELIADDSICDCCKKNLTVTQGVCTTIESAPKKHVCRGPCAKPAKDGCKKKLEDKKDFDRNQDELEKPIITATPKDSKKDLPTLTNDSDSSQEKTHISSNIANLNIEVQEQTSPGEKSTASQEPEFIEGITVQAPLTIERQINTDETITMKQISPVVESDEESEMYSTGVVEAIVKEIVETAVEMDGNRIGQIGKLEDSFEEYGVTMWDFKEAPIETTSEQDDNKSIIELFTEANDNYTPRAFSFKYPLELTKLQTDESIVPDGSCQMVSEEYIPRATTVETTTITDDITDKVVGAKEVLTPGEVNKIFDNRLLPLPIIQAPQQVPVIPLPQVLPEAFETVPRAVMPECMPPPVSAGFLPRLFGTRRSTTSSSKKDSVSQTEDDPKPIKSTERVCPKTGLICDCCKKNVTVTQGVCTTIESAPKKHVCRGPCAKPAKDVRMKKLEDKKDFDRNQDELEKLMITATLKDSKKDLPTLMIHKDAEIIALRNALTAKESYCAEQRKIATAALEQLENIRNIVEERDDLRKKLETSQDELEQLKRNIALGYPFGISEPRPSVHTSIGESQSTTCEEEIAALESEINDMRSGKLTPNLEAKVIRKEVEVLKKYCSKLSVIQKENHQLKNQIAKYEDKLNRLGCLENDDHIDDLKDKLNTWGATVKERDELKCKCNKLEKELMSYNDLPEDIEVFKQRSLLLDEVLQDRDRLSKRVEQLRGVDEELYNLKKKSCRIDELEENLKRLSKDKKFQDEELEHMRCKCSFAEIEALNQKAEGDTLKSKIACLEHEVESMRCLCKDKDRLKQERDDLKRNLDELVRMQNNFDHMKNQMKCMDMLKKEKDVYKSKYESLMGLECECDILRAQVERAKGIEKERDALENQVEDLESCIADQENEIRRLVCHIDILAKGRDEQQEKLKDVLCTMRAELEKKDKIIGSSEEKLSLVQKELITSIQGLSSETTNLKTKNDTLEKCVCNLQKDRKALEKEKENLQNHLSNMQREKRDSVEEKRNLQTCLCNLEMTAKSSIEEKSLMKVQIANIKKETVDLDNQIQKLTSDNEFLIEKLQEREAYIKSLQDVLKDHEPLLKNLEILKQTAREDSVNYELEAAKFQQQRQQTSLPGDEHLHELLRQSKHAVQKIALELCKQYEEWDCVKSKLKKIKKDDESKENNRICTCCTCNCKCGRNFSRSQDNSTQDRSGDNKGVTAKIMDSSATQDDGVIKDNKAVLARGLENAGTQYPKKQGIANDDYTKWDCYIKRNQKDDTKIAADSSPCDCKSVGITAEECEKSECEGMKGIQNQDKKSGDICECVSTGTDCEPLEGQDAATYTISDEDKKEGKTDETSQDQTLGLSNAPEISQDDTNKYEYDVSKWSCKTTVQAEPKDDAIEYELDVSKWSCRQPKSEEHIKEEETEEEIMLTARSNEDKCKHLEDRIEILEKELAQANETILKLQGQLAATDRTAAENKALRRHSSEVQEVAKDQIEDLVEHLKKAKERVAFLEDENAKLNDLLKNMQLEKDEFMKMMKGLHGETEESEPRFRMAMPEKQLSDDEPRDETLRNLPTANKNMEGENELLRKRIAELEKALSESNVERDDLKKGKAEEPVRDNESSDLDELRQKDMDDLMSQIQKLKKEKEDLEKMLASNVLTTSRRSSKIENELETLAKKNKELQDENNRLKQFENDIQNLMQKLSLCKDENKQLRDDLDKANSEIEKLKKQKPDSDIIDALKRENESLLKKLEAQAKEISDLLDKMKTPKPAVEISKSQLERDLKEKQTLQSIIADLENQLKNLSGDDRRIQPISPSDDLQKIIRDLTKRLEDEQKRADAAELALRNMKTSDPSAMLNADIAKLKNDLSEIESENTKLKQQLAQSTNEAAKLKRDLDTALNEVKKMNEENAQLKQQISNLQKENNDLKSSIDKLKSGLSGDDFLKSEVQRLNDQVAQLEKDKMSLRNEVTQKDTEMKNAYEKISKLQNEIGDLKQNQVKLQSENDRMKKDLDNAANNAKKDAARISQLEDDNSKLRKDIQSLEGELAKAKSDLDSALNAAKKGSSGVSDLQDEIMKLKQKIVQLEAENADLKRDLNAALDNSKSTAAKLTQLTSEIEKLKNAKDDAEGKLGKLRKDSDSANADAKKAASDLSRQQNDMADMKNKLAKLEAENAKLKKDLNAALEDSKKSGMDEDDKLKQKLAQLENENSKLKRELEKALDEAKKSSGLDKLKDDDNKLRERIEKLEADNSKLNKDLNAALDKLAKATDTISQLQDEQNKLKQKLSSLENDNAQLKKDLNKSLDDAKKSASEISTLRDSESKLKQRIAQLESENAKLKKDLDAASMGDKNNLNTIQLLKDENNKLKLKISQLEQENSKLNKDVEASLKERKLPTPSDDSEKLKTKVSQLEEANSKLKKDLDSVMEDHKKCSKTISQLQDEIERLKKKLADLEKDGSNWKNQYEGAMGDMKMSNDELKKLRDNESKLKQLLDQVQSDNGKLNKDITALTAELKNTAGNLALAKDEAAKAKQRIGLLEAENAQLKKNLDGTLDEMKRIQKLLSQLQEENPKLKQRIAQLETDNAKLKNDLDAALADAKKGSAGADQIKSEDAKLKDLLAQLEKENKKLKADLNNALDEAKKSVADVTKMRDDDSKQKQQISKIENENAKLKRDLEKALNDALANSSGAQVLRDENNKLKQRVSQLEGEIAKLKSDLNAALENAKLGASGLSQIQADDAKLKQRISQLEKDNAKLKKDLESALNEAKAGSDTGTKLRNEIAMQKQMIAQLEDEIAKLKKNLSDSKGDSGLSNIQDENTRLKQRISQLEKDNATLKKNLDDALASGKTASSANAQLTDENGKLKQKIKQLEGDIDKLRKDLNTALDEKKQALANLATVRDNEAKQKQRIAELESNNMKLKQDVDSASGNAKSGKDDLNRLRDENASMKQRIAQLEGDNAKLKKDLEGALSESKNKAGEVQRLKDENAKLKQKIADLETGNAKMKRDFDSGISDSRKAASELDKLKNDLSKLEQASAQKDGQLNDLKKKLDDKDSKIAELKNENDKLKGKIRDLENQVAKLGEDLAKLKRESAQKDGQINDLKKNLDKANADSKGKDAKIKDLENKLVQEGSVDDSLAKLRQEMGLRDDQVNDLKNRLEKAMNDNRTKDDKIKELADENEKLKTRLKDLENQLGKLNDSLKKANDMAKKAGDDLSKMKGDYDKLKTDNEMLIKKKPDEDELKQYEAKIKQLQAELAKQKKECTDNIASMKEQFDREMKDLLKKNEASIAKLQKAHDEFLKDLNERHDRDIKGLQDALKKAKGELDEITKERDRLKALLEDQRRKSIEIRAKVEQVDDIVKKERRKSREESHKSKSLEEKLDAEKKKSKDLESMSFLLKKSIEDQKRTSEEFAKEKEVIVKKLEKEKDNLERSSLDMQKAFEEEKRKSLELANNLEGLKRQISEIPLPMEKKERRVIEPASKEPLKMQTFNTFSIDATMPDVIAITTPLSEKELKFYGKVSCPCIPNLDTVLEKLAKFGLGAMNIEELQLLHTKISDATANVLAKIGQSSGVLKPSENDKLGLLKRIASLEGDLLKKQRHAQQKVIAMQFAVKLEKERLSDLRKSLDEEKLKNSELLSQIGSQSKVVSNIQEERDLIQRQKSYHEQKLEQYLIAVEEERGKSRNLEDELEKEKSNTQHLKSLLETERSRSRQNKRKDTESLEAMRIKLEKTMNSEMMLRMKLQEKTCRRHPSPHNFTPVRDNQPSTTRQSPSRPRPAFYTDLSPGDGTSRATKRTFSSHSGGQSGSSNGLDLEDK